MRDIEKLIFYRTGEVIRDLGVIYFNTILEEMKSNINSNVEIKLKSNYLEVINFNKDEFYKYLIKNKIFQVFLKGVKQELKKKKIELEFLSEVNADNFLEIINSSKDLNEKIKSSINKRFKSKYFPYMRNSAKYGANSQNEDNFHKNIKELIYVVSKINLKNEQEQKNILQNYEARDRKCIVCHSYLTTTYDITHKKGKKQRKSSKYNYLFMGSEGNTFNNYAEDSSSVCFVCEFFNLMYLLYLSLEKPNVLAYTDNLDAMKFINYKLMLSSKTFNEKGFYRKLGKLKNTRVRIYDISTDSNKGVLINLNSVLEFEGLLKNIKLSDIVDRFTFSKDNYTKKSLAKGFIKNSNNIALKSILLNELFVITDNNGKKTLDIWKTVNNVRSYLEIICDFRKEKLNLKENGFEKLGVDLGNKIAKESKKTIAFKINQMLKSDNRQGLFQVFSHLIVVNELSMPKDFAGIVIYGNEDRLHYNVGKFLEKFLIINKEEEK